MVASSFRRVRPRQLGLSRSSLEPRVKSAAREGEAATSYLAIRVRWNVAADFSFSSRLSPVRWRQLASISISTCGLQYARRCQANASLLMPAGGGRPLASPPRRRQGVEAKNASSPESAVRRRSWPCSQLASRRTRNNAGSEAAMQTKLKNTDLTVHSKSIRCFLSLLQTANS
jgi:hypothetical protein